MHHGYAQAEGVANLDKVAPVGCLVAIGYPKLQGGTGGYARYIAICPAHWKYGVRIGPDDAPLPRSASISVCPLGRSPSSSPRWLGSLS